MQKVAIELLKVHPKNAEIYGQEDVGSLVQDIQESQWIETLTVTSEYVIVSGHRRYKAALVLGLTELPVDIEDYETEEAELERLLRKNQDRTKKDEQRIREGMAWEKIEKAKAEGRARKRTDLMSATGVKNFTSESGRVTDIIARRVGDWSGVTYEKGKEVVEYIDEQLKSEDVLRRASLLRMALNGPGPDDRGNINAASKLLKKMREDDEKMRKDREEKEAKEKQQEEARHQRYLMALQKAEHCKLYHCSVADFTQHVAPASVDCILTDPPYPKEYLPVYGDLARFAAYALKPGGSLVVMVGQSYLPEVIQQFQEYLTYQWMLAYLTPGGQSAQLWQRKVNTFWKPVLWFVKGEYVGPWIGDVCKSDVNDNDKRFHHWGQSESGMRSIMERMTQVGDIVCDPFVGGGTTAIVAMEMERQFVGCDIDETCVSLVEEKKASILGIYE